MFLFFIGKEKIEFEEIMLMRKLKNKKIIKKSDYYRSKIKLLSPLIGTLFMTVISFVQMRWMRSSRRFHVHKPTV